MLTKACLPSVSLLRKILCLTRLQRRFYPVWARTSSNAPFTSLLRKTCFAHVQTTFCCRQKTMPFSKQKTQNLTKVYSLFTFCPKNLTVVYTILRFFDFWVIYNTLWPHKFTLPRANSSARSSARTPTPSGFRLHLVGIVNPAPRCGEWWWWWRG